MPRRPIPTWTFALVVARYEHRFLIVRERDHEQRWYLPAGRVEPGESFAEGALRETLEESGVHIDLTGILCIQHTPSPEGARLRVIFTAQPAGDPTPLATPGNEHALEARWVTIEDLDALDLRSDEVKYWFELASEGPVYPLELLEGE